MLLHASTLFALGAITVEPRGCWRSAIAPTPSSDTGMQPQFRSKVPVSFVFSGYISVSYSLSKCNFHRTPEAASHPETSMHRLATETVKESAGRHASFKDEQILELIGR